MERMLQCLCIFGALITALATCLFFQQTPLLSQAHLPVVQNINEYLGPTERIQGPEKVRVQLLINDAPSLSEGQIESVSFNGKTLTLKPRDVYGFRGQASFQMPPGRYLLKWTVRRDRWIWPRTVYHSEEITLSPNDLWVQIQITGSQFVFQ